MDKGFWELLKELFTIDRYMALLIKIFSTGFIVYLLWTWFSFEYRTGKGAHEQLWWVERNIPAPERVFVHDTIIKTVTKDGHTEFNAPVKTVTIGKN